MSSLQRGETILPILQRDNKKLHETVSRVEKELRETRETLQSFSEFASKGRGARLQEGEG
jgi:hypothetical protein